MDSASPSSSMTQSSPISQSTELHDEGEDPNSQGRTTPPSTGGQLQHHNFPPLSVPKGWKHRTFNTSGNRTLMRGTLTRGVEGIPLLSNIQRRYNIIRYIQPNNISKRKKGWQRPGTGPRQGRTRVPSLQSLEGPFTIAAIHLAKDAIHFQQLYTYRHSSEGHTVLHFTQSMAALSEIEASTAVSNALKRNVWTLTHQLGVPSFLMKLKSPHHAIALIFLTDRPGHQWWCSHCVRNEINVRSDCNHTRELKQCLQRVAVAIRSTQENLIYFMAQSAAFNHMTDVTSACFYGEASRREFALVRTGPGPLMTTMTSADRVHIVKHLSISEGWKCLAHACSGISDRCIHKKTVEAHIDSAEALCFPNIRNADREDGFLENRNRTDSMNEIPIPRYSRPMIPSEIAFQVDCNINRDARNGVARVIRAAQTCHCSCPHQDPRSSSIENTPLRIESARCFVTYTQETWTCGNGHCVLPEEDSDTREGIIWISKNTAFTEAFLFDIIMNITMTGATITGQADIRSQIFFLQTQYMSRADAPRSAPCVRKALIMYAVAVVRGIPPWVFRCPKCATQTENGIYYDKISFDGQQIGFNIKKDVRYDFYGKPAIHWSRPVERCPDAWRVCHLIESAPLRTIITETLRVRDVPPGCNSVQTLCRVMMSIPLRTKDAIRAAVAAIKLFDSNWAQFVPGNTPSLLVTSYQIFLSTSDPEVFSHPFQYISEMRTPEHFQIGIRVLRIFREVLDCRRAAAVISVLVQNLRNDLRCHIPPQDQDFITNYSQNGHALLNTWLSDMALWNSWTLLSRHPIAQQDHNTTTSGIADHTATLEHPFRPPFSWIVRSTTEGNGELGDKRLAFVRNIEQWYCPTEADTAVLLMLMAIFNEPVTVWIRNGHFTEVEAAGEVLRNAERYAGSPNPTYHYRAALHQTYGCSLLYEGIMGLLGANTQLAKPIFAAVKEILDSVKWKHDDYKQVMNNFKSKKSFMCSPNEFDQMLYWTGAFADPAAATTGEDNNGESGRTHMQQMMNVYKKMASSCSEDLLETGVWAPDFPVTRPSPSYMLWSGDVTNTENSCSKNYDVHKSFSPGTFGGYCLCKHVKTLAVIFLKRPEGCRMPLNFIVERCPILPRVAVYDFACGTQRAASTLSAKLLEHTSFVIDPFHFPGHKSCSLAMHQRNHESLHGCNTESQEQRNSGIKNMEKSLRACKDSHFMHFIILAHGYLNLKAMYRDHHDSEPTEWGERAWVRWVRDNLF